MEHDGEIEAGEWEGAIGNALEQKLAERAKQRAAEGDGKGWTEDDPGKLNDADMDAALAALMAEKDKWKEDMPWPTRVNASGETVEVNPLDVDFVAKFLDQAAKVFKLIDLDDNGGMTMDEVQESIAEEPEVVRFFWTSRPERITLQTDDPFDHTIPPPWKRRA